MRLPALIFSLFFSVTLFSQQINIIPQPVSVKQPKIAAKFSIDNTTQIVLEGSNLENSANFLKDYLQQFYKLQLKVVTTSASKNAIRLNYERMDNAIPGAYDLSVNEKGVYIAGDNETGVFYGIQTLIQLLPVIVSNSVQLTKLQIPFVSITDYPRFSYRGLHLDVGRHFMPVDFIKKYIDYIALHKMNYFHWHLTEDQGWRIEIKKYPKLTQVGAWRNGTIIGHNPGTGNDNIKYGGFYTQEQIKDVVAYAQKRYITIIPEIEMPGHSSAAIAAYPELSCFPGESTKHRKNITWSGDTTGKQVQQSWGVFEDVFCPSEYTFNFLQDVLDEVIALFPSPYIHVGGDECPKESWKRSVFCQQLIKEKGLKDEHGLQSYFIQRMEKYINNKGKKLIGWDEILEGGLAPNAVVMSWRGEAGGIAAAKQEHDVIMTPENPVYFDHSQTRNEDSVTIGGYNPIEKVYAYEPVPKEMNIEDAKHVLGAQANIWTEYMLNPKKVEYMVLPRLSALSEVLWSPKEKRNWNDFEKRLQIQFKRYGLWKANYSKAYFDLNASILPNGNYDGLLWKVEARQPGIQIKYITHSAGRSYELSFAEGKPYTSPVEIKSTQIIAAISMEKGKPVSNPVYQTFFFNKATGGKIILTNPPSTKYSGDGAITLINGVINDKGRARSNEFLGFEGTDCEALIDLGTAKKFSNVKVHIFQQPSAWILRPQYVEIFSSADGINFTSIGITDDVSTKEGNGILEKSFNPVTTRYVKLMVKNWGEIPEGNSRPGGKPWLFVDEIEVN